MENVQNKDMKGGESSNGGHVCAMCQGKSNGQGWACGGSWRGWHGHHSVLRILIGVGLILAAFCAGTEVGEHGDRDGYGRDEHSNHYERHMMRGYEENEGQYQDQYGDPRMMMNHKMILKKVEMTATGTPVMPMMK